MKWSRKAAACVMSASLAAGLLPAAAGAAEGSGPEAGGQSPVSAYFFDENEEKGFIEGDIRWTAPEDDSEVESYVLTFQDKAGKDLDKIAEVENDGSHDYRYELPETALAADMKRVAVYSKLDDGSLVGPATSKVWDNPDGLVMITSFMDADPAPNSFSGTLKWEPLANADITGYEVWLLKGHERYERLTSVAKGARTEYKFPDHYSFPEGVDGIGVFAIDYEGMPIDYIYDGEFDFINNQSAIVDQAPDVVNPAPADVPPPVMSAIYDFDAAKGKIAGWISLFSYGGGYESVDSFTLYFGNKTNPKIQKLADVRIVDFNLIYLDSTAIPTGADRFTAYSNTSAGQSAEHYESFIWDSPAAATNPTIDNTDPDEGQIGGKLTWGNPDTTTKIAAYKIGWQIDKTYDFVKLGQVERKDANEFAVPANTAIPANALGLAIVSINEEGQEGDYALIPVSDLKPGTVPTTPAPDASRIAVQNNAGKADSVTVTGLKAGDVVKAYASPDSAEAIGTAAVANGQTSAVVTVDQLGTGAGSVYVTLTSKDDQGKPMKESLRTKKDYAAEPPAQPAPLNPNQITIENNMGDVQDTVKVTGLLAGDQISVYRQAEGGTPVGNAVVKPGKTEVELIYGQLGIEAGTLYVSLKRGDVETPRTAKTYAAEAIVPPAAASIRIVNNPAGTADTVQVSGLQTGDSVKVFNLPNGGQLLGSANAVASTKTATVTIDQLGEAGGTVYVAIRRGGADSSRTAKEFGAEAPAEPNPPAANQIAVANEREGTPDKVKVTGLLAGDTVKVYAAATGGTAFGSATVAPGATEATVSIAQLGKTAGTVYVSLTRGGVESRQRTAKAYAAEPADPAGELSADQVKITNKRPREQDVVLVTGLKTGDVIKLYKDNKTSTRPMATSSAVAAGADSVTVNVSQLGAAAGKLYVSLTRGKTESARVEVAYAAEPPPPPAAPAAATITVTNSLGRPDTVTVNRLVAGYTVNVYAQATGGAPLKSGTAGTGQTEATLSIDQLSVGAGTVYVSLTRGGQESARTAKPYSAEPPAKLDPGAIVVQNNQGRTTDIAKVTVGGSLQVGDVVKVYKNANDPASRAIGTSSAVRRTDQAVTITLKPLGEAEGSVYVSIVRGRLPESERVKVDYGAEPPAAPAARAISVVNELGRPDKVTVTGLLNGDVAKVYRDAAGGAAIGSAAAAGGTATVAVEQLGAASGTIYVTISRDGRESNPRTAKPYDSEPPEPPAAQTIRIVNNQGNSSDTVVVGGLLTGDVVKVYKDAQTTRAIASSRAVGKNDGGAATVSLKLPTKDAGSVFLSISRGRKESARTEAAYGAEPPAAPPERTIEIVNRYKEGDTVSVKGLLAGDGIKIYASANSAEALGSGTVGTGSDTAQAAVALPGSAAGKVYVSVVRGGLESSRTAKNYTAEPSAPFDPARISGWTNAGGKVGFAIDVRGLAQGTVLKIYKDAGKKKLAKSVTVGRNGDPIAVSLTQLSADGGTLYITQTSRGQPESAVAEIAYPGKG
ncbi:hypothetical protein H7B90_19590 [Cohnella xylanilytica]|uniref:S-layer family protein n=1 Tax=Cohnella xylanilytica TaxID=557555 RepID=A0A841U6D4_9BACL|nr:hypothetical protein [Cohnella xylanilytica]MBB6693601.1 hypothetical protein [Cohnella xylanilytica]